MLRNPMMRSVERSNYNTPYHQPLDSKLYYFSGDLLVIFLFHMVVKNYIKK